MCGSRKIICSLLLLSALEIGLGVSSIALGAVGICRARPNYKPQQGDASPMTLFSACCICGLIGGILSFQFIRALAKRPQVHQPLHLVAMTLACLGVACSTLATWLTCRLAGTEQQRMFLEREHSMHHSHEMTEKQELPESSSNGLPLIPLNGSASTMLNSPGSDITDRTLVDTPYSCLVVETHRRHIALSPLYLRKKKTGIQEQLNAELLKYSESLNGVPLAYDDIKVVGQHGDIHDDSELIHMNIEAVFVIFQPRRGQKLSGVINKVGVSHVGCLVHGCFNAAVPRPAQVTQEAWLQAGLGVGHALEFQVSQLDADTAGVLLIRGRLDKHRTRNLAEVCGAGGWSLQRYQPHERRKRTKTRNVIGPGFFGDG
ncbi:hypothetical protein COCON_G00124600 [Conger conger]|uniref:DNA-directed RNA polymerase I subunit RPA43 n=1 Tax=Conger conger TaxID=82655 RepID=A0A9Q1DCQ0_CONCO|nr:hypothetical protein COCON_G00124600 [Conger conger]